MRDLVQRVQSSILQDFIKPQYVSRLHEVQTSTLRMREWVELFDLPTRMRNAHICRVPVSGYARLWKTLYK